MPKNLRELTERNDEYFKRTNYRTEDENEILDYYLDRDYKIVDDYDRKYNSLKPILNKIK